MTWFAFQGLNGGKAIDLAGTQEKQAVVEGFHGYGTEAAAEKQPNAVNFLTRPLADTWIADYNAAVKEQAQPGGKNANIINPVTAAKAGMQSIPGISGIDAIGQFFGKLTDPNVWIRVAKVVVGGALLIIGLAHMTGAENAVFTAARNVPVIV